FQPVSFWFNTGDENGINNRIADFDSKFNQLSDQYFNQLYFRQSKEIYDSVVTILNNSFPNISSKIFANHKNLKLKLLETEVFRLKSEDVSEMFSSINPDFWKHPAFVELFEKIFTEKLSFDAKEIKGTELRKAVAEANYSFLFMHVKNKYKLTGVSTELVLLKMLHDGFYSGEFPKNSILNLLGQKNLSNHSNLKIREFARNISNKLKHLLPGSTAPVICLKNTDGHKKCTDETGDKFKYIIFADVEMIVCREHLKYLTKIEQQFQKHLEIILILRKTDLIEMKLFLVENKIPGVKLVDENGEFISKYKIKSFPSCFLLDQNHKIIFSGTKAPLDGFEQQFGAFLQQKLFERQRNQSR
ncbi:MAG: redoxin domain-containing protein, partial [Prolixibacteraceae bacterium]|nr:redoxin domain-containing protein [Prolixibacteraceae bacterium]